MAGLLSSAISGLKVSQNALKTTGHNIANANTPGYSRQSVQTASNAGQYSGAGFVGNGARAVTVERAVDQFLISQLRGETSLSSGLKAFTEQVGQLDNLLSASSTGVSASLNRFYAAMETAADDPSAIAARQQLISQGQNLSDRFNSLYDNLETLREGVDQKMTTAVHQINALSKSVAELNLSIAKAWGETSHNPNDLLDQRDELLRQMSELINIDVVDQGDGMLNVHVGSGQALVVGNTSRQMTVVSGNPNPQQKEIAYIGTAGLQVISRHINGGQLGGLMDFSKEGMANAYNELGRLALVVSESINEAHRRGIDLSNQFGGNFFRDVNEPALMHSRVFADSNNALPHDRLLTVAITDVTQLTTSDYVMEMSSVDTSYRIIRQSDGASVYSGSVPATLPGSVEFDGITLNVVAGTFQPGDRFLIQPTKTGARDMASAITEPMQLALASPLETAAHSGNLGNATISAGTVNELVGADGSRLFTAGGAMDPPLLVQFTSATTYEILNNSDPGRPASFVPAMTGNFVPGQTNSLELEDLGISVSISGVPAAGDRFTLSFNTDASTDNRNALSLIGVSHAGILNGGNTTIAGAYSHLVEVVGIQAHAANLNLGASQHILTQTQGLRDSMSGVNLDEEAADLIRFEQMYNANAQVISVARDLFERLVGMF